MDVSDTLRCCANRSRQLSNLKSRAATGPPLCCQNYTADLIKPERYDEVPAMINSHHIICVNVGRTLDPGD